MSDRQARESNDTAVVFAILALGVAGLTLGYAPWALAAVVLATIFVVVATAVHAKHGLLARRSAGVFILMLLPAALQAYVYYPRFLQAYNPQHAILPLGHAWHPSTLQHYPALLATLTIAVAALFSSLILTYSHIRQRRRAITSWHWVQVGDHSGQYPAAARRRW